jgi:1,4-alpha-glucan branching enzyme
VNITPILAEQLRDPGFAQGFVEYCREKEAAAMADAEAFRRSGDLWMEGLASFWHRIFLRSRRDFEDLWNGDLVGAFGQMQAAGHIEIITCGATHGYQPLLGTEESCRAQIELARDSYRQYFGHTPGGIWLPECAYRPRYEWKSPVEPGATPFMRAGTDEWLARYGIDYFYVDSHMIRGGVPLGTYGAKFPQLAELFARSSRYFTPPEDARSEYESYALATGVDCFARDPETTVKVWSGEAGYPGDEYYLEFHKQLYPGRHRYWRISQNKADLGQKQPYRPYEAYDRIVAHARDLVDVLKSTLAQYRGAQDRPGLLTAMYDTELFGHWWWEGPEFLYHLYRELAADGSLECVSGSDAQSEAPPRYEIPLPEGSWGEGGYHYIWLNEENAWTWKRLYPAERRMREMSASMANGPARRIVTQAGRELLLAEASDWQFLISTWAARDYAELRFTDHMERFERLADMAVWVHDRAPLAEEDEAFLEECETKDAPFANLDPELWSPVRA